MNQITVKKNNKNEEENSFSIELKQYDAAEIKGYFAFKAEAIQSNTLLLIVEMEKTKDTRF